MQAEPTTYSEATPWIGPREFVSITDASIIFNIGRSTITGWISAGRLPTYPAPVLPEGGHGRPPLKVVDPLEVRAMWAKLSLQDAGRV